MRLPIDNGGVAKRGKRKGQPENNAPFTLLKFLIGSKLSKIILLSENIRLFWTEKLDFGKI